jgi:hypothetical protein
MPWPLKSRTTEPQIAVTLAHLKRADDALCSACLTGALTKSAEDQVRHHIEALRRLYAFYSDRG